MNLIKQTLIACIVMIASYQITTYAATNSPVGTWQTIDDVSGKPKALIQIQLAQDNSLIGKVIKVFPQPSKEMHEVCEKCKGEKHNQPIVGMSVLSGLKATDKNQWGKGEILDPANGKTYHCTARLSDKGDKLNVRGYIGMPLLGRSQTWMRIEDNNIG